jgi:hypothetical protein
MIPETSRSFNLQGERETAVAGLAEAELVDAVERDLI